MLQEPSRRSRCARRGGVRRTDRRRLSGLGRGRPDLRQPRRSGPRGAPVGARGRYDRGRRAAVRARRRSAEGRPQPEQRIARQRAADVRSRAGAEQDRLGHPGQLRRGRLRAADRRSAGQHVADAAGAAQRQRAGLRHRAPDLFPRRRDGAAAAAGAVDPAAGQHEGALLRAGDRSARSSRSARTCA